MFVAENFSKKNTPGGVCQNDQPTKTTLPLDGVLPSKIDGDDRDHFHDERIITCGSN